MHAQEGGIKSSIHVSRKASVSNYGGPDWKVEEGGQCSRRPALL